MKRKTILLLLVLGVAIGVLVAPGVALASWTDISDASWVSQYGVTAAQVDTVADGYPDGTFKPSAQVTRGQFTKMAVNGLDVPVLSPLTPTFSDVPRTHIFYTYIEGANAAGLVNGIGGGLFAPSAPISRQQVATILARWLSEEELDALGYIAGPAGTQYPSLSAWYAAQGATALASFFDQASIASVHRPGVAYLAAKGIAQGSGGYFSPMSNITRAQAAVLVLRVLDESGDFGALIPTVTDVNPDNGPAAGGTAVVITGTNFTAGATVKFGTASATNVTVYNATQITAVSPAGTAGTTVQVSVTTGAGTSANTAADNFTYGGGPTVTDLDPNAGPAAGNNTVTITGTNFTADSTVKFGTKAATSVVVVSATKITVKAPSGTTGTVVDVLVTTPAGTSANTAADNYTYGTPTVTSIAPTHGPADGGTTVVITGTNFTADSKVFFGATQVSSTKITVNGATKITVTSPAGTAGNVVQVKVTTDAGSSPNTADDDYTYDPNSPVITSMSKNAGVAGGGNSIYIYGTGFGTDEDAVTVMFGSKTAVVISATNTTLRVTVPSGAAGSTVDVRVTTDQGTSPNTQADDYAYGAPTITSLLPDSGDNSGGTIVIITGTGFTPDATVYFDTSAVDGDDVTVDSPEQIRIKTPSGTGTDNVTVRNDAGTSAAEVFTYTDDVPFITSLSKNAAVAGTTIYIYGGNFAGGATVEFGGTPATVSALTSTRLTVVVPAGAGTVDVSVTVGTDVSPNTPADDFAYSAPTITSLTPEVGDPLGGTMVVITGTGFTPDVVVKFGGVAATVVSVNGTNTELTVITPAGDDGDTVDVTVRNDLGTATEHERLHLRLRLQRSDCHGPQHSQRPRRGWHSL